MGARYQDNGVGGKCKGGTEMKVDIFNTDKKYQIIYADPPWETVKGWSKGRLRKQSYGKPPRL